MTGAWDALLQPPVTSGQRGLRNALVGMLRACALPHLRPEHVTARTDGEAWELAVGHDRHDGRGLRVRIEADGSGWLDCEPLEPGFHLDFDGSESDDAFVVDAAALILHGWATADVRSRPDGRRFVLLTIESPEGEALLTESYETRSSEEGRRVASWASRAGRQPPPPLRG